MTRQFGGNYLWEPLPGVACRQFRVITTVDGERPRDENIIRYKRKVGKSEDLLGTHAERSDRFDRQFRHEMPGYDIEGWPANVKVDYGYVVKYINLTERTVHALERDTVLATIPYDILVSTVPLPALMAMTGKQYFDLKSRPIFVWAQRVPLDAPPMYDKNEWRINYISDPDIPAYRTTDRDGDRHYESLDSGDTIPTKKIMPGKIYRHMGVPDLLAQFERQNVYCFGRFARWEPDELVHETDAHIRVWKEVMKL